MIKLYKKNRDILYVYIELNFVYMNSLPHFPLDEVGEYEDRQDNPGADPRSKVEKWIPG